MLWALTDHENSVRDLAAYDSGTDVTTIANHRVYDSFGNLKSETNSAVDCLFGYTGRQLDEATGLQNNLNRWYDAKVGRWMSQDPIEFEGEDANLYRYVGNEPMGLCDPSGLLDYEHAKRTLDKNRNPVTRNFGGHTYDVYTAKTDKGRDVTLLKNPDADKPDLNYNCHGRAYANQEYVIPNEEIGKILKDDFTPVKPKDLQPGDIAVYSQKNQIVHSATVADVNKSGLPNVNEKNGLEPQGSSPQRPLTRKDMPKQVVRYYRPNRR